MRLVTFVDDGRPRLGVVDAEAIVAAATLGGADSMADLLAGERDGVAALAGAARSGVVPAGVIALHAARLLSPVPAPPNIVCVGRNYAAHAAEGNVEVPAEPLLFGKHTSSVRGPTDDIEWSDELTTAVDFEAELGVVIGRPARRVPPEDALDFVLGYTCLNDVTARDLQLGDKQWLRGKSLDSFCPMGPVLVTSDEIGDPQQLTLESRLNGAVMQHGTTADMLFSVARIISHASYAFTLQPGDVIGTGTPEGVGFRRKPPVTLQDGDLIEVEVEGIGTLRNRCRVVRD